MISHAVQASVEHWGKRGARNVGDARARHRRTCNQEPKRRVAPADRNAKARRQASFSRHAKPKVRDLTWEQALRPIDNLGAETLHHLQIQREVIPIVFVPGIMGSVLERRETDGTWEKAWDPDDGIFMLTRFGTVWTGPACKRRQLIGDGPFRASFLRVRGNNRIEGSSNGWEGIATSTYGALRAHLEGMAWTPLLRALFDFPVYGFGYNWSAGNAHSGDKLRAFIAALLDHHRSTGLRCDRVLLVTHSMGGLVARHACLEKATAQRVLGVLHGVQPVHGAPAAYWRMKGGFERHPGDGLARIVKWILGTNGKEVTALLGNMPGGLQLLPTTSYRDPNGQRAWLRRFDARGKEVLALPKHNPYREIYAQRHGLHRLVRASHLHPEHPDVESSWLHFRKHLQEAERFHAQLGGHMHEQTYAFAGRGGKRTIDEIIYREKTRQVVPVSVIVGATAGVFAKVARAGVHVTQHAMQQSERIGHGRDAIEAYRSDAKHAERERDRTTQTSAQGDALQTFDDHAQWLENTLLDAARIAGFARNVAKQNPSGPGPTQEGGTPATQTPAEAACTGSSIAGSSRGGASHVGSSHAGSSCAESAEAADTDKHDEDTRTPHESFRRGGYVSKNLDGKSAGTIRDCWLIQTSGSGDETVPDRSGAGLDLPAQGNPHAARRPPKFRYFDHIEHEGAFQLPAVLRHVSAVLQTMVEDEVAASWSQARYSTSLQPWIDKRRARWTQRKESA